MFRAARTASRWGLAAGLLLLPLAARAAAHDDRGAAARAFLATIRPSAELQAFLDRTVDALVAADARLHDSGVRVALLDLGDDGAAPRLAERHGEVPVYPASVVKFVYLMAAHAWQEQGRLRIDPELDRLLTEMIHNSSNVATQRVVARLAGTEPGPALPPDAYRAFRERRLAVKRWLATLGVTDLHCVSPTYNGGGDLFGRDVQFLKDGTVSGGLPAAPGEYPNRQAMTAVGTAKLLALLATDRALSPASCAAARARMRRDPAQQPYQRQRISGGAKRLPDVEVYSKTGTWGPIFADAGIVRHTAGREFVLAVFTDDHPAYRGDFIAELAYRATDHLLGPSARH